MHWLSWHDPLVWAVLIIVILLIARPRGYAYMIGGIVLLVAGLIFLGWWMLRPKKDATTAPVTREQAAKMLKPNMLPPHAHDIQYEFDYAEVSPGFSDYVRIEAPVEECHAVAAVILPKLTLEHVSHPDITAIASDRPKWFDPGTITNGTHAGRGYEGEPSIWIDEDHGVLYYLLGD